MFARLSTHTWSAAADCQRLSLRFALPFLGMLSWSTLVHAESGMDLPEPRFTDRGRLMLGGSVQGYISNDTSLDGTRTFADWLASAWPEATYFVRDRLGMGVAAGGGISQTSYLFDNERTAWHVGALVGVTSELRLSERVSFLPRVWLGFIHEQSQLTTTVHRSPGVIEQGPYSSTVERETTRNSLRLVVEVPLIVHLSSSIAVGVGPLIFFDHIRWSRSSTENEYGDGYGYLPSSSSHNRLRLGLSTWVGASF